ncbi:aldehyde dehydrogenase family protein [Paenibacillus sp. 1P07SE]|uniref:aldehyde dehydrogenase family protein n=1 Tax=Paenibacillus sp. 1P07SE TaxID=3132209 RepID=UPI0039A54CB2
MIEANNYIGGRWCGAESGERIDAHNPADPCERLGSVPRSAAADAEQAVLAADAAAAGWRDTAPGTRGELLRQAALQLDARSGELADLLTREMGKTLPEALGEVKRGVAILHYYAGLTMHADGAHLPAADGASLLYTQKIPLGVVALITPWNFPVAIPVWKLAPALASGNTVVLKPATQASLTAARLMEILCEAGFPDGVLNLVHGSGAAVASALIEHPLVQGVSFTGSNGAGKRIAQQAAARGIKYQLEMGGKNAVIVLADADLERAADAVVSGAMKSAGQKCTATSKVIVMPEIRERFTSLLLERLQRITMGPGTEEGVYYGPLASREQQRHVLEAIAAAGEAGAELLHGGGVPEDARLHGGYFVEPTLFTGVDPASLLAREEIFGPVLALLEAPTLAEAIRLANDTEYGLSAAIFTTDLGSAMTFIRHIEAGMVKVNSETAGVEYQAPFGGLKQSSSHSREQGLAALDFYTHTQTISLSM